MSRHHPAAREMLNDFAERMASDFEETLLHNVVYDRVPEDGQLQQLCEAAARAEQAATTRRNVLGEDVDFADNIDRAEGRLQWTARQRAIESVAEACAVVIREAEDWDDAWDERTIDGARREATDWLRHHTNEGERAGVLGALDDAPEVDA